MKQKLFPRKIFLLVIAITLILLLGCSKKIESSTTQPKTDTPQTQTVKNTKTNQEPGQTVFKLPSKQDFDNCEGKLCTIAIVIKQENYDDLKPEISTWIQDIERETGKRVELKIYNNNVKKETIKSDLRTLYYNNNLRGAILVGDVPIARSGVRCSIYPNQLNPCLDYVEQLDQDLQKQGKYINDPFVTDNLNINDYYYTDIDNQCKYKQDLDAFYQDTCLQDSRELPFWISRLTPPRRNIEESNQLLKNYLIRNHKFRTGQISFQEKFLAYLPILEDRSQEEKTKTISDFLDWYKTSSNPPYPIQNIKILTSESSDNEYFSELGLRYEHVFYNGHGSANFHQKNVDSQTIINKVPKSFFYEFGSCSVGRYNEEGYLGGEYLFNSDALISLAAQSPVFTAPQPSFHLQLLLTQGTSIGEASKIINIGANRILGDGTLKLRYKKIVSQNRPKIVLDKYELDFGELDFKTIGKKFSFKIRNIGNAPLVIYNDKGNPPKLDLKNVPPENLPSIAGLFSETIIPLNEEVEYTIDIIIGGWSAQNPKPYTGKYSGSLYLLSNDPDNYVLIIPFKGEIIE
ncbi:MAG: hypothetical protein AABX33_02650 [Nanoarchaeota archaeon]